MSHSPKRRTLLLASAGIPLASTCMSWAAVSRDATPAQARLQELERQFGGRLGLFALNTANGTSLAYRADERFPFCSTFKVIAAAAVLARSTQAAGLMQRHIRYRQSDLAEYSPITEQHVGDGMSVAELCAAALQYSDNTAANLLIGILGGTQAVTAFARAIGDKEFRLDRWETALNTAIPGDPRDTTTPAAMGRSMQRLALGAALPVEQRQQLQDWLCGNTTGATRIKAGIPVDWKMGDKTGSGHYGTANDVAVLWPPQRQPLVLAVYTTQSEKEAKARNDVIATAARIVVDWLG